MSEVVHLRVLPYGVERWGVACGMTDPRPRLDFATYIPAEVSCVDCRRDPFVASWHARAARKPRR